MPRINRALVYLGACLIAGIRLAREPIPGMLWRSISIDLGLQLEVNMHNGSVIKKGSEKALRYLAARARLVLWAAEGVVNQEIAVRLHWSKATVGKWRQRFVEHRLVGIYDGIRAGRPRSVSD